MASSGISFTHIVPTFFIISLLITFLSAANAQLSPGFYAKTCPDLENLVRIGMKRAVFKETRIAASILRLFFHDAFVQGPDASILLDDTPTFTGEKNAFPNVNSARGFEVIDDIKSRVESACTATVSCADILTLAARDGVVLLGGPYWDVPLGRRDSRTANQTAANMDLPPPFADLATLKSMFAAKGLYERDMTALSGAHTIGFSQCANFRDRIYNDTNIDPFFARNLRARCSVSGGDSNLGSLDVGSPLRFDNKYYLNLLGQRGLLHSDQELFKNDGSSVSKLVRSYALNGVSFARDFTAAMIKLGNITPLTGNAGEIRRNCRVVN